MTEEMKTCDFYNEKICTLFSKYFDFNVECENLFLSTIDCDIERECPIKRLEQENKELKKQIESDKGLITVGGKQQYEYLQKIDELEQENRELKAYKDVNEDFKKAWDELNKKYTEVLKLAKENVDSNEYCLQELEQKYEKLRSALEEIREIAEKYKDMEGCRIPLGAIKMTVDEVLNLS